MCVHMEIGIQIMYSHIFTFTVKSLMDIPFMMAANEVSLPGRNFFDIHLPFYNPLPQIESYLHSKAHISQ